MIRVLAVAFCLLPAAAQSSQQRARAIVGQALEALGGARYLAMADRVEQGRAYAFSREQLSGLSRATLYTRYLTRPDPPRVAFVGVRERQAFGKDEDVYTLYNETGAWEITFRGAKPLGDEFYERFRETTLHNVLYILRLRLEEPGMNFELRGPTIFENQPMDVVEIADADNRIVSVYFHQSSHLPVRQSWERRDPKTKQRFEEVTVFSKFRDAGGGAQWPFVIRRERNGEKIFEMFADSVRVNAGLTDELFTLSGDTKLLKKK
jgi:hypothetical protein